MSSEGFSIASAGHTGFTVTSLEDSLAFWHHLLGLPILYRRKLEMGPVPNVVGIPDATIETAMLSMPGGHRVELLEYKVPQDRVQMALRPCDVGNVHLVINIRGINALVEAAKRLGWQPAADEPRKLRLGDGNLWALVYLQSSDGVTVELMEQLEG